MTGDSTPPPTRKPIAALLAANLISDLGNAFTWLAIPWFVLETTGSAARTGLTVAAGTLPLILAGFLGGAIVDRLGAKRMSIAADLASALNVALIPLLHQTIGLAFWQLLVLVVLGAVLDSPGRTARVSLLPDLARQSNLQLERANAISQMAARGAGLAGPPLAGVLIAAFGATSVLWLDAATFVVSAIIVAAGVPNLDPTSPSTSEAVSGGSILDGLRFIRDDRLVRWLIACFSLGSLLAEPLYTVVLPVYARQVLGSAVDLGIMYAALAAGSLAGNLIFIALAPRLPRRATIVAGFTVRALTFWVLIPLPPLAIVAASIVLNAVFLEPTNPVWMSILQERVPEHMRGRVFGALTALAAATGSLGIIGYGLLLDRAGLQTTLVILAAVNLAVPLMLWLAPPLREIERQPAPPSTASSTGVVG